MWILSTQNRLGIDGTDTWGIDSLNSLKHERKLDVDDYEIMDLSSAAGNRFFKFRPGIVAHGSSS